MLTAMVMATLLVNVFGAAAALPFIAAQNLLSRSLQTEPRDAMGGPAPPGKLTDCHRLRWRTDDNPRNFVECALDNARPVLPRGRGNQIAAAYRGANP